MQQKVSKDAFQFMHNIFIIHEAHDKFTKFVLYNMYTVRVTTAKFFSTLGM